MEINIKLKRFSEESPLKDKNLISGDCLVYVLLSGVYVWMVGHFNENGYFYSNEYKDILWRWSDHHNIAVGPVVPKHEIYWYKLVP